MGVSPTFFSATKTAASGGVRFHLDVDRALGGRLAWFAAGRGGGRCAEAPAAGGGVAAAGGSGASRLGGRRLGLRDGLGQELAQLADFLAHCPLLGAEIGHLGPQIARILFARARSRHQREEQDARHATSLSPSRQVAQSSAGGGGGERGQPGGPAAPAAALSRARDVGEGARDAEHVAWAGAR